MANSNKAFTEIANEKIESSEFVDELSCLDTGQWSILHLLLTHRPGIRKLTFWKSYFTPYIITALFFFGLLLTISLTLPFPSTTFPGGRVARDDFKDEVLVKKLIENKIIKAGEKDYKRYVFFNNRFKDINKDWSSLENELKKAGINKREFVLKIWRNSHRLNVLFLDDWNCMCMYLLTLPLLITLLLTERTLIPERLTRITEAGIIKLKPKNSQHNKMESPKEFRQTWEIWFKKVNVFGQISGVVVGYILYFVNHGACMEEGYAGWQLAEKGVLNILGQLFLYFHIPVFWWTITFYAIRGMTTIILFNSLTKGLVKKIV